MKQKKQKPTKGQEEKKEEVFTKEDFFKALRKATRPLKPKVSRVKEKSKTSE